MNRWLYINDLYMKLLSDASISLYISASRLEPSVPSY